MSKHRPFPRRARNRWVPVAALAVCSVLAGSLVVAAITSQTAF
ncbi:hypothetical protein [Mycetocola manganoxydans]|nr:hypothetical protein [Mycetocola manganoxydans]